MNERSYKVVFVSKEDIFPKLFMKVLKKHIKVINTQVFYDVAQVVEFFDNNPDGFDLIISGNFFFTHKKLVESQKNNMPNEFLNSLTGVDLLKTLRSKSIEIPFVLLTSEIKESLDSYIYSASNFMYQNKVMDFGDICLAIKNFIESPESNHYCRKIGNC